MDPSTSKKGVDLATDANVSASLRRPWTWHGVFEVVKFIAAIAFIGLSIPFLYEVIHFQTNYAGLQAKYNDLVAQMDGLSDPPIVTLAQRAVMSANASVIYTTTTVTKGTTVTVEAGLSSRHASLSSISTWSNTSTVGSETCSLATPKTVTVTSTANVTCFASSSAAKPSSYPPVTVIETRVTTATIFVTHSGVGSPKPKTQTLTATATELHTTTVTAGAGGKGSTGTSTSTADAVFGTKNTEHPHFPNSTTTLPPYGTPGHSGIISTASFTLTVPPGTTRILTKPPGTSTSTSDPVSTVVTVSRASKTNGVYVSIIVAAAIVAFLHF